MIIMTMMIMMVVIMIMMVIVMRRRKTTTTTTPGLWLWWLLLLLLFFFFFFFFLFVVLLARDGEGLFPDAPGAVGFVYMTSAGLFGGLPASIREVLRLVPSSWRSYVHGTLLFYGSAA